MQHGKPQDHASASPGTHAVVTEDHGDVEASKKEIQIAAKYVRQVIRANPSIDAKLGLPGRSENRAIVTKLIQDPIAGFAALRSAGVEIDCAVKTLELAPLALAEPPPALRSKNRRCTIARIIVYIPFVIGVILGLWIAGNLFLDGVGYAEGECEITAFAGNGKCETGDCLLDVRVRKQGAGLELVKQGWPLPRRFNAESGRVEIPFEEFRCCNEVDAVAYCCTMFDKELDTFCDKWGSAQDGNFSHCNAENWRCRFTMTGGAVPEVDDLQVYDPFPSSTFLLVMSMCFSLSICTRMIQCWDKARQDAQNRVQIVIFDKPSLSERIQNRLLQVGICKKAWSACQPCLKSSNYTKRCSCSRACRRRRSQEQIQQEQNMDPQQLKVHMFEERAPSNQSTIHEQKESSQQKEGAMSQQLGADISTIVRTFDETEGSAGQRKPIEDRQTNNKPQANRYEDEHVQATPSDAKPVSGHLVLQDIHDTDEPSFQIVDVRPTTRERWKGHGEWEDGVHPMFSEDSKNLKELAKRPTADLLRPIVTPIPERSRRKRGSRGTPTQSRAEAWTVKDNSTGLNALMSTTTRSWNESGHTPALLAAQASSSSFRSTSSGHRWGHVRKDRALV